jgi:hypothetical protein
MTPLTAVVSAMDIAERLWVVQLTPPRTNFDLFSLK